MIRLSLSIAVAALLLAAPAGAMGHPKLIGVVGKNDAFTISLKTGSGSVTRDTIPDVQAASKSRRRLRGSRSFPVIFKDPLLLQIA